MERTQSAVSKLEHSTDAELSLQDIASYLNATGGRLNLGVGKQPNRVERIKELAICLKGELESLADLSSNSDDPSIRQSINGFFGEAWFNLFKILCDTTSRLPKEAEETSPLMLFGSESACVTVAGNPEKVTCRGLSSAPETAVLVLVHHGEELIEIHRFRMRRIGVPFQTPKYPVG